MDKIENEIVENILAKLNAMLQITIFLIDECNNRLNKIKKEGIEYMSVKFNATYQFILSLRF
jgi:hypothetical protein